MKLSRRGLFAGVAAGLVPYKDTYSVTDFVVHRLARTGPAVRAFVSTYILKNGHIQQPWRANFHINDDATAKYGFDNLWNLNLKDATRTLHSAVKNEIANLSRT